MKNLKWYWWGIIIAVFILLTYWGIWSYMEAKAKGSYNKIKGKFSPEVATAYKVGDTWSGMEANLPALPSGLSWAGTGEGTDENSGTYQVIGYFE